MSTPTTVKFQILVPLANGKSATEQVYTLTLSLLVEGGCGDREVKVIPLLETSPLPSSPNTADRFGLTHGEVLPVQDPPKPN